MEPDLVATKIRIPPASPHAVPRPRLTGAIEDGIRSARLVLVAAPAGYGKTTLVAQWARASDLPVAWLTVDESDNDVDRFLRYLLSAWESVQPGIRETAFGLLLGGSHPERDRVLVALVNAASSSQDHIAIVVDDAHQIDSPAVMEILDYLLDHGPATIHLVLATRFDPPVALARRRARGELLEFHASDLEFERDETQEFLGTGMGLHLNDEEVLALNQHMEGWAAGLQLAALRLHRDPTLVTTPAAGSQRDIVDYLTEDVLDQLPEDVQTFLFRCCILERLTHGLCHAVTGNPRSQDMLEWLERSNLFLMPLDDSRTWFHMHRVFATVLRQTIAQSGEDLPALHRRAAGWFLGNDFPEQAFQHAVAAQDIDLTSAILDRYVEVKMFGGEVSVVAGWLDALPGAWRRSRAELILAQAKFLVLTGRPDAASEQLALLDQLPRQQRPNVRLSVARAEAIRCFMACFRNDLPEALAHSERAFRQLPADDLAYRANLYHALGDTFRNHQLWEEARANYRRVLELVAHTGGDLRVRAITVHSFGALADLELRQGHLRAANAYWARALDLVQDRDNWGRFTLPVTGWIYLRLGELAYARNDLDLAREYLSRGIERADLGGDPRSMIAARAGSARLALASGELTAARTSLDEAESLLDSAAFPDWTGRIDRLRIDTLLAERNLQRARSWTQATMEASNRDGFPPGNETLLAVVRVLIDDHAPESLPRAREVADTLVEHSVRLGLDGVAIEALALRAIIRDRQGDEGGAMTDLDRALHMGEAEGFVRLFADIGLPMLRLLRETRRRAVLPAHADTVLAAFGEGTLPGNSTLPEALSPREVEVLRLLAAGLTNREIGAALFVSPETIKKHTMNIYGKLGVRGRVEAVSRGRSLSLID